MSFNYIFLYEYFSVQVLNHLQGDVYSVLPWTCNTSHQPIMATIVADRASSTCSYGLNNYWVFAIVAKNTTTATTVEHH